MSALPKVAKVVRSVLKMEARKGKTTKQSAAILVWKKIEGTGGPSAFGIGRAAVTMACLHIIEQEISRQFKAPVSEHARVFILPPRTPPDILKTLGKIPTWIAIEDKANALWVPSLQATSDHWATNAGIKEKKAHQTQEKANDSWDIALFMSSVGIKTLEEIFQPGGGGGASI